MTQAPHFRVCTLDRKAGGAQAAHQHPGRAGVCVGLGCSPGHQPPGLGEAVGSSLSLAVRDETDDSQADLPGQEGGRWSVRGILGGLCCTGEQHH